MGKEVWEYRPMKHKGTWLGKGKVIFIGPQAQLVIRPFLKLDTQAPLFSPREALAEQLAIRKANRKEPIHPCEVKRGRKKVPRRQPGERYTVGTYYQAIVRACRRAGVPEWSPLQLRHTAATEIRSRYGLEAAQVILGHSRADVTQIYAERDLGKAQEVIRQIG
jgi:integrase